jgi:hypothetical protein
MYLFCVIPDNGLLFPSVAYCNTIFPCAIESCPQEYNIFAATVVVRRSSRCLKTSDSLCPTYLQEKTNVFHSILLRIAAPLQGIYRRSVWKLNYRIKITFTKI